VTSVKRSKLRCGSRPLRVFSRIDDWFGAWTTSLGPLPKHETGCPTLATSLYLSPGWESTPPPSLSFLPPQNFVFLSAAVRSFFAHCAVEGPAVVLAVALSPLTTNRGCPSLYFVARVGRHELPCHGPRPEHDIPGTKAYKINVGFNRLRHNSAQERKRVRARLQSCRKCLRKEMGF
jgi:hypothetical protein